MGVAGAWGSLRTLGAGVPADPYTNRRRADTVVAMEYLAVCTGNTCRSPMLAALLRQRLAAAGLRDRVTSAGTGAASGEPASAGAIREMAKRGIDLAGHRSANVRALDLAGFDRVLCMSSSHAAYLRSLGVPPGHLEVVNAEGGGVPDPYGGDAAEYAACAEVLARYADALVGARKA
jgi:protein-tyrosine-phosphatase